jgi:hypothetical protein
MDSPKDSPLLGDWNVIYNNVTPTFLEVEQ